MSVQLYLSHIEFYCNSDFGAGQKRSGFIMRCQQTDKACDHLNKLNLLEKILVKTQLKVKRFHLSRPKSLSNILTSVSPNV